MTRISLEVFDEFKPKAFFGNASGIIYVGMDGGELDPMRYDMGLEALSSAWRARCEGVV